MGHNQSHWFQTDHTTTGTLPIQTRFPMTGRITNPNLLDIETEKMKYDPKYAKLYHAVRTGNWEATGKFLEENPGALTARISIEGKLPLHVAAFFGHLHIVKELLLLMSAEDVELQDFVDLTALQEISFTNYTNIAECLIEKNSNLLTIATEEHLLPVTRAVDIGQVEMARYLYPLTPKEVLTPEYGKYGATLLNLCYYAQLLDMALDLLHNCPSLAVTPDRNGETLLEAMTSMPSAFPSGTQLSFWQRWIYSSIDIQTEQIQPKFLNKEVSVNMPETTTMSQSDKTIMTKKKKDNKTMVFLFSGTKNIYQIKLVHMQARELLRITCQELYALNEEQLKASRAREAVVQASRKGIPEIFTEVIKVHLAVLWQSVNSRNPIFDAVQFRQAGVYNLVHGMIWKNALANLKDTNGNTLLHMAGLLAPSSTELHDISGAALQLQRELQWFKEVESITPSNKKETLNNGKFTGRQLFTENHKELVKQGEKWMKGTASSCSVVAALVATIVFAAAFTVPGGNDQNTGYPIFYDKRGFTVFIISDAVSLFSSSTSILMFLDILTSRYAEDDFLESLPRKLIIGLLTLFISMASMLLAFCAALFVMLDGKLWIVVPVNVLAAVPVFSLGWLQYPLLREMIMSTYGLSIFDRDVKPWLTADLII